MMHLPPPSLRLDIDAAALAANWRALDRLSGAASAGAAVKANAYGLGIDSAEQTLWGESADAATARRLDAPLHTPLLVFRRISCARGQPLEHVVSRYRGDRYQVHMSLGADPHGPTLARSHPDHAHHSTTEGMNQ